MAQPVHKWVPSIAPSGMAFVTTERFPAWRGSLLVGALRGEMLVRLDLDGEKVVREERMLQGLGERIRDVRQGPDGWLYLLTDAEEDGRVLRLDGGLTPIWRGLLLPTRLVVGPEGSLYLAAVGQTGKPLRMLRDAADAIDIFCRTPDGAVTELTDHLVGVGGLWVEHLRRLDAPPPLC